MIQLKAFDFKDIQILTLQWEQMLLEHGIVKNKIFCCDMPRIKFAPWTAKIISIYEYQTTLCQLLGDKCSKCKNRLCSCEFIVDSFNEKLTKVLLRLILGVTASGCIIDMQSELPETFLDCTCGSKHRFKGEKTQMINTCEYDGTYVIVGGYPVQSAISVEYICSIINTLSECKDVKQTLLDIRISVRQATLKLWKTNTENQEVYDALIIYGKKKIISYDNFSEVLDCSKLKDVVAMECPGAVSYVDKQCENMLELQLYLKKCDGYWGDKLYLTPTFDEFCKAYSGKVIALIPEIVNVSCPMSIFDLVNSEWMRRGWTWKEATLANELLYMNQFGTICTCLPKQPIKGLFGNYTDSEEAWLSLRQRKWTVSMDFMFVALELQNYVTEWLNKSKQDDYEQQMHIIEVKLPCYSLLREAPDIPGMCWLGSSIDGYGDMKYNRLAGGHRANQPPTYINVTVDVTTGNMIAPFFSIRLENCLAIYGISYEQFRKHYQHEPHTQLVLLESVSNVIKADGGFDYINEGCWTPRRPLPTGTGKLFLTCLAISNNFDGSNTLFRISQWFIVRAETDRYTAITQSMG